MDPTTPFVTTVLSRGLRLGGWHGLYNEHHGCGCRVGDLAPCGEIQLGCRAGVETRFPDGCDCSCGEGCDFHIGPRVEDVDGLNELHQLVHG